MNVSSIYRHFKGGYYIVHSLALIEKERDGEEVVVYQSLQDGQVWIRPVSEFQEPVPEGKPNPTGQKLRFEKVTNFNNQLSLIPTDKLLSELLSREDCPPELLTLNPEKVWRTEYLIGRFREVYIDHETTKEDFFFEKCTDTLEEAVEKLKKTNNPNLSILMRTHIRVEQDFD